MLVKVGIRLEIQVVQLQIMEKQIFKSCTFTFSGLKIILYPAFENEMFLQRRNCYEPWLVKFRVVYILVSCNGKTNIQVLHLYIIWPLRGGYR